MTDTLQGSVHKGLTALIGIAAALSSQLPGISFFTDYAPPDFGVLKLMTSGLTLALFVWVFSTAPAHDRRGQVGMLAIACAVVLAVIYSALLSWVTVRAPPEVGLITRFQIGFGMMGFSLTPDALAILKSGQDIRSPEDLMLAFGAFRPEGPRLIWHQGTITAAWLLLSGAFVLTYATWAYGLSCVAWKLTRRVGA